MSAFQEALKRCKLLAGKKPSDQPLGLINSYYSYPDNKQTGSEGIKPNNKNNNFYKGLKYKLHTDEKMKLAQTWGIVPRYLFTLCSDYGFYFVRSIISRVENIGDGYFRQDESILMQRGKYCRAIILKEGKRLSYE